MHTLSQTPASPTAVMTCTRQLYSVIPVLKPSHTPAGSTSGVQILVTDSSPWPEQSTNSVMRRMTTEVSVPTSTSYKNGLKTSTAREAFKEIQSS